MQRMHEIFCYILPTVLIISHDLCEVKHFNTKCVKKIHMKERLKELRKEKGVTQAQVAKAIGITMSAYSNYEQGIREPSIELLKALCRYFMVSSDYLIGLED